MAENIIKFTRGVPPPESFPTDKLAACAQSVLAGDASVVLQYGDARGYPPLRRQIASYMGVDESRVIIGQGSLQLVDVCIRMLLQPGDLVYVEEPTYDRILTILRRANAQIVGFPLGDDGPDVDEIEIRLKQGQRPRFFYLIPDFQNPSGTVMSSAKRTHLARLACQYNFIILEDIPYRRLRYRNEDLPSLFELAPDHVMQLSSYSKLICPGLRVGYITALESLAKPLSTYAGDTYINSSYFNQAIVYEFIHRGWQAEHLIVLKDLYRVRLDAMLSALQANFADLATWHKPDGGFFIGMTLNEPLPIDNLLKQASKSGLVLSDGGGFFTHGGDQFIRLPFCALTPAEIEEGVSRLNRVIRNLMQ
jgi:DNA-binding transcriptional MocR family regulator